MPDDALDALRLENAKLRAEIEENRKAFDAVEYLRLSVAQLDAQERRSRRKDGFKLPSGVYETMEDIGKIGGALDMIRRIWNFHDENARKASMHLSKLEWDLRKRLQDLL